MIANAILDDVQQSVDECMGVIIAGSGVAGLTWDFVSVESGFEDRKVPEVSVGGRSDMGVNVRIYVRKLFCSVIVRDKGCRFPDSDRLEEMFAGVLEVVWSRFPSEVLVYIEDESVEDVVDAEDGENPPVTSKGNGSASQSDQDVVWVPMYKEVFKNDELRLKILSAFIDSDGSLSPARIIASTFGDENPKKFTRVVNSLDQKGYLERRRAQTLSVLSGAGKREVAWLMEKLGVSPT